MALRLFIFGALISAILSMPTTTQARSPERPTIAQPACTITGTQRNDVLRGTNRADVICGLGGNDVVYGLGGNDTLIGGAGNDTLHGGPGSDTLRGDGGNDALVGNAGDDALVGGIGNDRLDGQVGHDTMNGDGGTDVLIGGDGDDSLNGGSGRDQVRPGSGDNYCVPDGSDTTVGRCRVDRNPPVFAPMALTRSVSAGQTVVFEWAVEDESSVVTWLNIVRGATGWVNWCGYDVFGTPVDQVATSSNSNSSLFRVECRVPTNAANGEYTVGFNAIDVFNNSAAQRLMLIVENGITDTDAPVLSEVTATRIMSDANIFSVSFRVDDATGVETVYPFLAYQGDQLRNSNGEMFSRGITSIVNGIPVQNDGAAWQYQHIMMMNPAAFAPAGTYTVWISVRDTLGNTDFIKTDVTVEVQ